MVLLTVNSFHSNLSPVQIIEGPTQWMSNRLTLRPMQWYNCSHHKSSQICAICALWAKEYSFVQQNWSCPVEFGVYCVPCLDPWLNFCCLPVVWTSPSPPELAFFDLFWLTSQSIIGTQASESDHTYADVSARWLMGHLFHKAEDLRILTVTRQSDFSCWCFQVCVLISSCAELVLNT